MLFDLALLAVDLPGSAIIWLKLKPDIITSRTRAMSVTRYHYMMASEQGVRMRDDFKKEMSLTCRTLPVVFHNTTSRAKNHVAKLAPLATHRTSSYVQYSGDHVCARSGPHESWLATCRSELSQRSCTAGTNDSQGSLRHSALSQSQLESAHTNISLAGYRTSRRGSAFE